MAYQPDWSVLNMQPHKAVIPDMPPTPSTTLSPEGADMLKTVQRDIQAPPPIQDGGGDYYKYAILASLLGSAGAGIGQAFRKPVRQAQALPSPQAQQMPITAPASLQALASTRAARKGF